MLVSRYFYLQCDVPLRAPIVSFRHIARVAREQKFNKGGVGGVLWRVMFSVDSGNKVLECEENERHI